MTGVDWDRREVLLDGGHALPFDSLVVASGATAKFFGIPGASDHSFPLYTLTDARRLRDHVLRRLEDVDAHPDGAEAGGRTDLRRGRAAARPASRWPAPSPNCSTWR